MVDYFSKWVHAYKLRTKCSKEICKKIKKYIFQYGPPKKLLSDQGHEFVNGVCIYNYFIIFTNI